MMMFQSCDSRFTTYSWCHSNASCVFIVVHLYYS